MARLTVPEQPSVKTIAYDSLLGVDYQSDSTEVSRRRSPDMVNMISDFGGNPVKRYGYREVGELWIDFIEVGDDIFGVRRAGPQLLFGKVEIDEDGRLDFESSVAFTTLGGSPKTKLFSYGGSIYIAQQYSLTEVFDFDFTKPVADISRTLGVREYVAYQKVSPQPSGISSADVAYEVIMPDAEYIPVVSAMLKPNGQEMVSLADVTDITGATAGVSLLTPYRAVEFCVQKDTVSELTFALPAGVNRYISGNIKVEIRTGNGTWEEVNSSAYSLSGELGLRCVSPDGLGTDGSGKFFRFACFLPKITFSSAPFVLMQDGENITNHLGTASTNAVPAYEPNLRVTYAVCDATFAGENIAGSSLRNGYYKKSRNAVLTSDVRALYDGRLFVASDNRVYYSRVGNPLVMDDDYYIELDSDVRSFATPSMGLAIICDGVKNVYIATGEYNEQYGMPVYSIKASNATVRLASPNCDSALNDEPMMLTKDGVYGLSTNYYSEKYSIIRSGKINRRLCAEEDYSSSVAMALDNYLYIAVGTHMYVLDGRHKDNSRNGDNSYESYFFDEMPKIARMWSLKGRLYFATVDQYGNSNVYTWNDDLDDIRLKYRDNPTWDSTNEVWSGGTPVRARWSSVVDGDGVPQYYKTLQKKGTMVTIAPPMQTSCQVTLIRDAHDKIYVGRFNGGTFALSDAVLDAFTKKKVKKYKRLQFVVENNEDEPFGIVSIVKSFITNNYAKR